MQLSQQYIAERYERKKAKMLEEYVELAKELERTPTVYDIDRASRQKKCKSARTYIRFFDSIPDLQKLAGLVPNMPKEHRPHYTKEIILRQLRELAENLSKDVESLTRSDIVFGLEKRICPAPLTIKEYFGTIRKALITASKKGCMPIPKDQLENAAYSHRARMYNREKAFEQLWNIYQEIGRLPRYKDIKAANKNNRCPSIATVITLFGTIKNLRSLLLKKTAESGLADLHKT